MSSPKWTNRYHLSGTLVTQSPLHIGTGTTVTHPLVVDETHNRPAEINAVATDFRNRAYLPASSVKGVLRQWAQQSGRSSMLSSLMGEQASGAKVEFHDAFVDPATLPPLSEERFWRSERCTCVMPNVAIDRVTRTAAHQRLQFHEFVPPGVAFAVSVTGQDLTTEERDLLCSLFEAFNHPQNPARLGAATADGWGACRWAHPVLSIVEAPDVANWLTNQLNGHPAPWTTALRKLPAVPAHGFVARPSHNLTIHVELDFHANFAVNDPARVREKVPETPRMAPLLEAKKDGRVTLPASSFRGALRSQAERILHTIHHQLPLNRASDLPAAASLASVTHPVNRLFGQPGWKSPLHIPDFTLRAPAEEIRQEFLAIDRFQGGGVDRLKFNALSAWQPKFEGHIHLDLDRLSLVDADGTSLGLLLFLLRDLAEGDIRFGFGSAKGYGVCSARFQLSCAHSPFPAVLKTGAGLSPSEIIDPQVAIPAFLKASGVSA